jgi:hypothetical protein
MSTLQRPVMHLYVSAKQRLDLHLDVSGKQEPVLFYTIEA